MSSFKSNLDIQQNQLLNAVLHILPDLPQNPVEGQLYYNYGKHTAYLFNGSYWMPWGEYSGGQNQQVKQYLLNIPNPSTKSSMVFVRLYQDQTVVRIDSHFSTDASVEFHIECRQSVNEIGINVTDEPIQAMYDGTETTVFSNDYLSKDNWLYLEIIVREGTIETPVEVQPIEAPVDGEILGLLTITITCVVG